MSTCQHVNMSTCQSRLKPLSSFSTPMGLFFETFIFFNDERKCNHSLVRPSVHQSVGPSVRPSVRAAVRPSVCPSVRLSVRLSVRPSFGHCLVFYFKFCLHFLHFSSTDFLTTLLRIVCLSHFRWGCGWTGGTSVTIVVFRRFFIVFVTNF